VSKGLVAGSSPGETALMTSEVAAAALALGAVLLACMGLTAVGERRRGHSIALTVAAGVFFPITWAVWYLRDERPSRRAHRA
jgi:hypothetical protein